MKITRSVLSALLLWGVTCGSGQAGLTLKTADVVSGYSNCSMVDNGDGTSTAAVTIYYNETNAYRLGGKIFWSRGILFYSYDRHGQAHNIQARQVLLGGIDSYSFFTGSNYLMYYNRNVVDPWLVQQQMTTQASVIFPNSLLDEWAAVTIRAGNYTDGTDVGEITGGAYISGGDETGSCKVIVDPSHPPPPNISITVNAPDWDLGELKRGEQSIPFSASKDQLCLNYSDGDVASKQFIITASSQNGEVNNQYRLKNQDEGTQIIPYQLALDSGSWQLTLPNSANKSLPLEGWGKTCFMPTFTTFAPKNIKKGDYSDVLTFNIVSKS